MFPIAKQDIKTNAKAKKEAYSSPAQKARHLVGSASGSGLGRSDAILDVLRLGILGRPSWWPELRHVVMDSERPPKHISLPRVFMNGETTVAFSWLGADIGLRSQTLTNRKLGRRYHGKGPMENASSITILTANIRHCIPRRKVYGELTFAERALEELGMSGRVKRTGHLAKFLHADGDWFQYRIHRLHRGSHRLSQAVSLDVCPDAPITRDLESCRGCRDQHFVLMRLVRWLGRRSVQFPKPRPDLPIRAYFLLPRQNTVFAHDWKPRTGIRKENPSELYRSCPRTVLTLTSMLPTSASIFSLRPITRLIFFVSRYVTSRGAMPTCMEALLRRQTIEQHTLECYFGIRMASQRHAATGPLPWNGDIDVVIDVPSGRVTARAHREDGKTTHIDFLNVPSYQVAKAIPATVQLYEKSVSLEMDFTFGGAIYACVDVADLGLAVEPANHQTFIDIQRQIKRQHVKYRYQEQYDIYGVCFFAKMPSNNEDTVIQKNVVVFADGQIDRSPCGSGTAARVACSRPALHSLDKGHCETGGQNELLY
ncbi:hypothetical protein KC364_g8 [Hortaea werneckii]|nr:hypothetical protein KC364_g8 [Hortaea werneckii]